MLTETEMQDILNQMARAYRAQDAKACAAMFAENAQLHSPFGPAAIGRAAIEALHDDWVSEPSAKAFTMLDHGSANALAWCLTRFSEGEGLEEGTSLLVLERAASGHWLIRSLCLYGDPASA